MSTHSDTLPAHNEETWNDYYAASLKRGKHPLYQVLQPYLEKPGTALELGCGVGHGVLYLVSEGWKVVAADINERALEIVRSRLGESNLSDVEFVLSSIEDLKFEPARFDLVVAGYCLFFVPENAFLTAWVNLCNGIKPKGLFMGQFMGPEDDWADDGLTVQTSAQIDELLAGFEILHHDEENKIGTTSIGKSKHWHIHHVIARKLH